MAQNDLVIANQSFPSFRSDLNSALQAIQTTHSGTSLPTGALAGQIWLDTTNATSPTLKFYDGTDSISLATINYTANTVDWLDSSVTITGLSTTATGTVLTLTDTAHTTSVNMILGNNTALRFNELTANGSNYIGLKAPASLSADLTFTLPSTDGTSGQALVTNGSGVLSFTTISSGLSWDSSVKTASTFTAVVNKGYFVDTTSNAITCTLPASATAGDLLAFVDYSRNWGTNKLTLNPNSLNFQGYSSPNPEYNTSGQSVQLVYSGSTKGWIPYSDDDVTNEVPQSYSIDFLVIGGGASGGTGLNAGSSEGAGGAGAGGFRTSTQTVLAGTAITVTVGDGASTNSPANTTGTNGSNSSISGSGLTTITSAGGGGGGRSTVGGVAGGCGGGGGSPAGSGASGNTPSTSPSQGNNGGAGQGGGEGGGGGGAGAVGVAGGGGGNGTASSITGSSVTYAGGGAGGSPTSQKAGGTGGGGQGGNNSNVGIAGTANLGAGGGGSSYNGGGGAGGKGVVILSVPTANYSATTTGSPTVTTSGSNTIIKFNGSGSYTA